jgi:hypothetical protein
MSDRKFCENCKYWNPKSHYDDIEGLCTRFPEWVEITWNHYCGEWRGEEVID